MHKNMNHSNTPFPTKIDLVVPRDSVVIITKFEQARDLKATAPLRQVSEKGICESVDAVTQTVSEAAVNLMG